MGQHRIHIQCHAECRTGNGRPDSSPVPHSPRVTPGCLEQDKLNLSDDFTPGAVAAAAALFADLVRIWEPDHAQLGTTAMYAALPLTRAAFISWTSSKAYAEPESDREVSFPSGDGVLRISRDWSVDGVMALEKDLVALGAPTASALPRVQDVPQFPDAIPPGLKDMDREVNLAPQSS